MPDYTQRRLRMPIPGYKDPYTGAGYGGLTYPRDEQQLPPSVVNGATSIPRPAGFINPPPGQYSGVGGIMRPTGIQIPGAKTPYRDTGVVSPMQSYGSPRNIPQTSGMTYLQRGQSWKSLYPTQPKETVGVEPTPTPEVSPFMENMYKSIENIDPEQRTEYLQTTLSSIKDRLDRYEFRIARGIPLTPEQQRQYDSIRGAYNDIQKYINNPTVYDEFFTRIQSQQ